MLALFRLPASRRTATLVRNKKNQHNTKIIITECNCWPKHFPNVPTSVLFFNHETKTHVLRHWALSVFFTQTSFFLPGGHVTYLSSSEDWGTVSAFGPVWSNPSASLGGWKVGSLQDVVFSPMPGRVKSVSEIRNLYRKWVCSMMHFLQNREAEAEGSHLNIDIA